MNSEMKTWRNETRMVYWDQYCAEFTATYWTGYGKEKIYFNSGTRRKNGTYPTSYVFDVPTNRFEIPRPVEGSHLVGIREAFGLQ